MQNKTTPSHNYIPYTMVDVYHTPLDQVSMLNISTGGRGGGGETNVMKGRKFKPSIYRRVRSSVRGGSRVFGPHSCVEGNLLGSLTVLCVSVERTTSVGKRSSRGLRCPPPCRRRFVNAARRRRALARAAERSNAAGYKDAIMRV